ncbi:MAG: PD40 domain-containing protein [Ardenticatenales bacterium]|nr:PD40 domain-containing protein [Ardenticatenales bacterium]
MAEQGYYRYPTVHDDVLIFTSEDDLWRASVRGGPAHRLTAGQAMASEPALSPDGRQVAYVGREEGGPEVYRMPSGGGRVERLTFMGADAHVLGWTPDGAGIVFSSNAAQPFPALYRAHVVPADGGAVRQLPFGPLASVAIGPATAAGHAAVLCRHALDIARWKRYRGGLTGELWVDAAGDGDWRGLITLAGNVARPFWFGGRIWFVSDHEGVGNLYSCTVDGADLARHTDHADYYVRWPATDGRTIVYTAGADIWRLTPDAPDPHESQPQRIPITWAGARAQHQRRFASPSRYLHGWSIHPKGHSVAVTARGKTYVMGNHDGAVLPLHAEPARTRLATWLPDGRRLAVVSDAGGEDTLVIHTMDGSAPPLRFDVLDLGRPTELSVSPAGDVVAVANHRLELLSIDIETMTLKRLDQSPDERITGLAWSPDGRWLAYAFPASAQTSIIKLAELATGEAHAVTRPVLRDLAPAWDPGGKYLYFLSYRDFTPVYDRLHFDLGFPRGMRPYLLTLRADLDSPFRPMPPAPGEAPVDGAEGDDATPGDAGGKAGERPAEARDTVGEPPDDAGDDAGDQAGDQAGVQAQGKAEDKSGSGPPPLRIDLDGIAERIVAFPVAEGTYGQVRGIDGKVLYTSFGIPGAAGTAEGDRPAGGQLIAWDFGERRSETLADGVQAFDVSRDGKTMIYRADRRLRVGKAGVKPPTDGGNSRKTGWVDLDRIRVSVDPTAEWAQMFREAWRLQRDHFWTADMAGIDWLHVYERYFPLLERVASRAEFSDLMWEMQGELGTSHAYEYGGDYRTGPDFPRGYLGADFEADPAGAGWIVSRIIAGDPWDEAASSPLARPGMDIRPGDRLIAIDGQRLDPLRSPGAALVLRAGTDVFLEFAARAGANPDAAQPADAAGRASDDAPFDADLSDSVAPSDAAPSDAMPSDGDAIAGASPSSAGRSFTVRTLRDETALRYRAWVDGNRAAVHAASDGRVGYVHVPDMGPGGYAEFHRGFLAESDRPALIVDVRYNRGGHVSSLLLEKLARRRIGYDVRRWGDPIPYPVESVAGPIIALCNALSGSDGDMFSHAFKLMGLGPLIGTRTWGGVVGIWPRETLSDGGTTTQPEYSFWFNDVGWGLENHGAVPDIEVRFPPQDDAAGRDPQLERGIAEALARLAAMTTMRPTFGEAPRRVLPGGGAERR